MLVGDALFSRINDLAKKSPEIPGFLALPTPLTGKSEVRRRSGPPPRSRPSAWLSTAVAGAEAAIAAAAGQDQIQELVDVVAHLVTAARPHLS